jgi:hypothetical protein
MPCLPSPPAQNRTCSNLVSNKFPHPVPRILK